MSLPSSLLGGLEFHDPWWLLLLVLPFAMLVLEYTASARWTVGVPTIAGIPVRRTLCARLRSALPAVRAAGLSLLVVAMARPIGNRTRSPLDGQGIDIALLVDVSGSMKSEDMARDESRLDVAKRVLRNFVERRDGDRMGIIAFARYPITVCPFTLDSATVASFIDRLEPVSLEVENHTAIGVALAQAVRRLKKSKAKSRIVVLLTDGANNVEEITPEEGAKLAHDFGIRVYTILAGREDPYGRFQEERVDPSRLIGIAETTHGKFFRAEDARALEGIYDQIDHLEKTKFREARYENFTDLFWVPGGEGMALLFFAAMLDHTWLRRLP